MARKVGPCTVEVVRHQVDEIEYLTELRLGRRTCHLCAQAHCDRELLVAVRPLEIHRGSYLTQQQDIVLPVCRVHLIARLSTAHGIPEDIGTIKSVRVAPRHDGSMGACGLGRGHMASWDGLTPNRHQSHRNLSYQAARLPMPPASRASQPP